MRVLIALTCVAILAYTLHSLYGSYRAHSDRIELAEIHENKKCEELLLSYQKYRKLGAPLPNGVSGVITFQNDAIKCAARLSEVLGAEIVVSNSGVTM